MLTCFDSTHDEEFLKHVEIFPDVLTPSHDEEFLKHVGIFYNVFTSALGVEFLKHIGIFQMFLFQPLMKSS